MPNIDLIDHSPQHPVPAPPVPTANNLILIDNYDSFTWNVYQYLVLEGANVTVYRNDEIPIQELIAKNPTQLVISPGPGHPVTDSGVSRDAIKHFAGKIPILGVCMGLQCIFDVFGGQVEQTGEILHGKTSPLRHDGRGVYAGLPQDLPVTRYHSLSGTHPTRPQCLELSSWVAGGPDSGKGVIMGVRHREFLVEGVQFHPESILTAEGRAMLKNFLAMRGGTWVENDRLRANANPATKRLNGLNDVTNDNHKPPSILQQIYARRRTAVFEQKQRPSQRPEDLQAAYDLNLAPPLVDFSARVRQSPYKLSLMAEIKRASPSKGVISASTCAPAQARAYALAGASVISVLTEPDWFQGSIDDLRSARLALSGMPGRPAVLRKEFVFDEYQILEARLAGADTFLLIVKMLTQEELHRLYHYGRTIGMEALVEVNTPEEMEVAVKLGAKVIGVNNRNLTSFEVDMDTTTRLMKMVRDDTVICALSGMSSSSDVKPYQQAGVGAVLVGEALMRAKDTAAFVREFLGGNDTAVEEGPVHKPIVKICGIRSPEAAGAAIEAGADLIGMILVPGRSRCVDTETALQISQVVHQARKSGSVEAAQAAKGDADDRKAVSYFAHTAAHHLQDPIRALLVGVFQNQHLSYILAQQRLLGLDVVQLHGSEPLEWATLIPCPVIRAFKPSDGEIATPGYHAAALLDSGVGGTGEQVGVDKVKEVLARHPELEIFLAGGLDPGNVKGFVETLGPRVRGVDVSSGVEVGGQQDIERIRSFVTNAKGVKL